MPFHNKLKKFGRFAARNNPLTGPFFRGRDIPAIREIQNLAVPTLATAFGGPVAGAGASVALRGLDALNRTNVGEQGQATALEQLTPERQAFEDAALVSLRQSGQLASSRGQAQGQAFASAGLAGSPLATSQIANQRRLADQSALDRITQARFGLESGIAGREFQQAQFDRSQRNAFIAIGAEIGFGLIGDFLFDELKGLIDFDELFGTNEVGTNIDILPGAETDIFA